MPFEGSGPEIRSFSSPPGQIRIKTVSVLSTPLVLCVCVNNKHCVPHVSIPFPAVPMTPLGRDEPDNHAQSSLHHIEAQGRASSNPNAQRITNGTLDPCVAQRDLGGCVHVMHRYRYKYFDVYEPAIGVPISTCRYHLSAPSLIAHSFPSLFTSGSSAPSKVNIS